MPARSSFPFVPVGFTLLLASTCAFAQPPDRELRGVWLTNVASDVYSSKQSLARAMDSLAAWGFNAVFPVVFNNGSTLFPSETMTEVTGQAVSPAFQDRDLLAELLTEAHRVGIEVHPWLEYGFVAAYGGPGPILQAHPDWAGKRISTGAAAADDHFFWMSQAHPEVLDFLVRLAMEIADRYDVDGIQLDRVRYGNVHKADGTCCVATDFGYDDAHVQRYRDEHNGVDPPTDPTNTVWRRWRSALLDEFHQLFRETIASAHPHVLVSNAPVVYPYGYELFLQDWRMWIRDGSVDFVAPQVYRYSASDYARDLKIALDHAKDQAPGYDRLYPGMLVRAGSYVADPPLVRSYIEETRDQGAAGHIQWFYEGAMLVGPSLRASVYASPALPPFRIGIWRPAGLVVQDDDPLNQASGFDESGTDPEATDEITRLGAASSVLTYRADIRTAASYDVFVYGVAGETTATVLVPGATGARLTFDQGQSANRGWLHVGTAFFEPGIQEIARFEHNGTSAARVRADAVMLLVNRKRSPEVEFTAITSPKPSTRPGASVVFPNPMAETATLSIRLDAPAQTRITVFDTLGRTVSAPLDRSLPAGESRIPIDGAALAPGLYVARVQSASRSEAVRFVRG